VSLRATAIIIIIIIIIIIGIDDLEDSPHY
jgi:hypothetical protein